MKANSFGRPLEGGRRYLLLTSALVIGFVTGVVYNQNIGTGVCRPGNSSEFRAAVQDLGNSRSQAAAACTPKVTTRYFSSAHEESWLENAAKWENDYCKAIATPSQQRAVKVWTDTLRKVQSSPATSSSNLLWDPAVFSRCEDWPATTIDTIVDCFPAKLVMWD